MVVSQWVHAVDPSLHLPSHRCIVSELQGVWISITVGTRSIPLWTAKCDGRNLWVTRWNRRWCNVLCSWCVLSSWMSFWFCFSMLRLFWILSFFVIAWWCGVTTCSFGLTVTVEEGRSQVATVPMIRLTIRSGDDIRSRVLCGSGYCSR